MTEQKSNAVNGKLCPNCYVFKDITMFGKRTKNGVNVGQPYCIPCKRTLDRERMRAIRGDKRDAERERC